eukprot:TRINITY_DN69_c0_g1_i12.p1 TRINITY_DN69_c0_g1~~TRINITY_DN69_c0_g1_i12.p1  ORF type:complete len:1002 (+),score=138.12 TRINITY_DN69_c0_g1_i12:244-3006(+)
MEVDEAQTNELEEGVEKLLQDCEYNKGKSILQRITLTKLINAEKPQELVDKITEDEEEKNSVLLLIRIKLNKKATATTSPAMSPLIKYTGIKLVEEVAGVCDVETTAFVGRDQYFNTSRDANQSSTLTDKTPLEILISNLKDYGTKIDSAFNFLHILGACGVGKTRLCVELYKKLRTQFSDEYQFCYLRFNLNAGQLLEQLGGNGIESIMRLDLPTPQVQEKKVVIYLHVDNVQEMDKSEIFREIRQELSRIRMAYHSNSKSLLLPVFSGLTFPIFPEKVPLDTQDGSIHLAPGVGFASKEPITGFFLKPLEIKPSNTLADNALLYYIQQKAANDKNIPKDKSIILNHLVEHAGGNPRIIELFAKQIANYNDDVSFDLAKNTIFTAVAENYKQLYLVEEWVAHFIGIIEFIVYAILTKRTIHKNMKVNNILILSAFRGQICQIRPKGLQTPQDGLKEYEIVAPKLFLHQICSKIYSNSSKIPDLIPIGLLDSHQWSWRDFELYTAYYMKAGLVSAQMIQPLLFGSTVKIAIEDIIKGVHWRDGRQSAKHVKEIYHTTQFRVSKAAVIVFESSELLGKVEWTNIPSTQPDVSYNVFDGKHYIIINKDKANEPDVILIIRLMDKRVLLVFIQSKFTSPTAKTAGTFKRDNVQSELDKAETLWGKVSKKHKSKVYPGYAFIYFSNQAQKQGSYNFSHTPLVGLVHQENIDSVTGIFASQLKREHNEYKESKNGEEEEERNKSENKEEEKEDKGEEDDEGKETKKETKRETKKETKKEKKERKLIEEEGEGADVELITENKKNNTKMDEDEYQEEKGQKKKRNNNRAKIRVAEEDSNGESETDGSEDDQSSNEGSSRQKKKCSHTTAAGRRCMRNATKKGLCTQHFKICKKKKRKRESSDEDGEKRSRKKTKITHKKQDNSSED